MTAIVGNDDDPLTVAASWVFDPNLEMGSGIFLLIGSRVERRSANDCASASKARREHINPDDLPRSRLVTVGDEAREALG